MRPGPATQAALLADVSTCLSPHKAAKCALSNLASPKECSFLHALCVKPATQSCCLRRTLWGGRNARVFQIAPKRVFELPPSNSPSRIAGSRLLCRNFQQSKQTHACTGDTLRHYRIPCNRKTGLACAQAVQDADSLWKALEKPAQGCRIQSCGTKKSTAEKLCPKICTGLCSIAAFNREHHPKTLSAFANAMDDAAYATP